MFVDIQIAVDIDTDIDIDWSKICRFNNDV